MGLHTPNDVIDLANGFFGPRALLAAARVGVFAALADGPKTVPEVARATRCDARGVDLLLHALTALALVEKQPGGPEARFSPGALARECLLPGSPRDLTDY